MGLEFHVQGLKSRGTATIWIKLTGKNLFSQRWESWQGTSGAITKNCKQSNWGWKKEKCNSYLKCPMLNISRKSTKLGLIWCIIEFGNYRIKVFSQEVGNYMNCIWNLYSWYTFLIYIIYIYDIKHKHKSSFIEQSMHLEANHADRKLEKSCLNTKQQNQQQAGSQRK